MGPMSTRTSSVSLLVGIGLGLLLLSGMGVVRGQGAKEDRGKVLGDRKCFLCHQDHKASFAASIHAGLGGDEDSVSCETCHGPGEKHVTSGGEVEFIVQYGKLDPAAASRKCMSCHGKTAPEGSHVKGFLESAWLAKGLGCNSCHQAHAAKKPEVPEAAPKPSKTIGEASCLVCHSDHRDYGHRPHVADALACETCHGAGRAHAEGRGDPALIRNPGKLEAPASDRSCLMCHSDISAPEHFKPEPGRTRCVDCHAIHAADAPAPTVAERETPGAPPFRLDLPEGEVPAAPPVAAGNKLRLPVLPAPETEGQEYLGVIGAGVIRFGGRWTEIHGNEDIYKQDLDLDPGFVLFDFDLSVKSAKNPGLKFRIAGEGSGQPVQHYLLDFRQDDLWSLTAKYTQTQFYYLASGDPRDWKAKRRNFGTDLTFLLGSGFRLTGGLDYWSREGGFTGEVLVAGRTVDGEEPFDESGTYAYVRLDWGEGPFSLSLTQGYRREEFEDEADAGKFLLPTDRTLDAEQETEVTGPMTTFLAEWQATKTVVLDARLLWSPFDTDTSYDAVTTGPGGGAGFVERTQGQVDGERNYIRAEIGTTWIPAEDWTVYARLEGFQRDDESVGDYRTSREDPPASPPAETRRKETYERDQTRLRARGEVRWQATDWLGILGGFEYITDDYTVKENGVKSDHDSEIAGPVIGLSIKPSKDLDIDFLYRFTKVGDPFTEIGTKDVDNARLRVRWRATDTWTFTGYARRSLMTNPRHETEVLTWGTGLGAIWVPFEELEIDATFDLAEYDTETEVVRYVGGIPEDGLSEYFARTRGGHLNVLWTVAPKVRLVGRFHNVYTTGDYATGWLDVVLGGEYDLLKELTLGVDGRYIRYNEKDRDVDDYSAYIVEFWLRVGF